MPTKADTVVFIHGAWMTPECWDDFRKPFEAAGYAIHAPTWPTLENATAAQLRANPPPGLGGLPVGKIVDHYQRYVSSLRSPPLLVGHSFGGLFVQMLLDRGCGAAGAAIDPGPIAGVIPGPVSLAAALPVVARWNGWNRPFLLSPKAFARSFANTAPADMRALAYDRLVVPTSGRIFYQAASWIGTRVKPKRRTQPLLIIVGEFDRTVTPYVARAAYNIQKRAPAPTAFKMFPGRSHFLIAEPGWQEVSTYVLGWLRDI